MKQALIGLFLICLPTIASAQDGWALKIQGNASLRCVKAMGIVLKEMEKEVESGEISEKHLFTCSYENSEITRVYQRKTLLHHGGRAFNVDINKGIVVEVLLER